VGFDLNDPTSLNSAMEALQASLGDKGASDGVGASGDGAKGKDNGMSALEQLTSSMSTIRANITGAKSLDGEAQIVMARGKKRHIYDFNLTLDFEVTVEPTTFPGASGLGDFGVDAAGGVGGGGGGGDSDAAKKKTKKFKGTLQFPEISPTCTIEPVLNFKKDLPSNLEKRIQQAMTGLKQKVCESIRAFEAEFKDM
jgi:hypothetical protein